MILRVCPDIDARYNVLLLIHRNVIATKGKTSEFQGNKTSKASITRKCLNEGFKIAQLHIRSIFKILIILG